MSEWRRLYAEAREEGTHRGERSQPTTSSPVFITHPLALFPHRCSTRVALNLTGDPKILLFHDHDISSRLPPPPTPRARAHLLLPHHMCTSCRLASDPLLSPFKPFLPHHAPPAGSSPALSRSLPPRCHPPQIPGFLLAQVAATSSRRAGMICAPG